MKFVKGREHELTAGAATALLFAMEEGVPVTSVAAIAGRLERTRKALGLNQTQLCNRVGIRTNTYNQWEKGKQRPSLDEAILLAEKLNLTLDWIYLGKPYGLPSDLVDKIVALQPPPKPTSGHRRLRVAR